MKKTYETPTLMASGGVVRATNSAIQSGNEGGKLGVFPGSVGFAL